MDLRDELIRRWRTGGALVRLVMVNLCVFVALLLIKLLLLAVYQDAETMKLALKQQFLYWLEVPYDLRSLAVRPWTLFTYMFTQHQFGHFFWNMVMLWFGGSLFGDLLGGKRLVGNYLLGGLSGAVLFLFAQNTFGFLAKYAPGDAMVGASASVMGVFIGIASYRPGMLVNLLLFGPVKLVYIAIFILLVDLAALSDASSNSGGHIAHLGGALYGYLAAAQLKKGRDWSLGFVQALERIGTWWPFRRGARMRVAKGGRERVRVSTDTDRNAGRQAKQERIDAILDKISRSGYDSLSREEKEILFKASKEKG